MLDIKWIREHAEEAAAGWRNRGVEVKVEELIALDDRRRSLITDVESLQQ